MNQLNFNTEKRNFKHLSEYEKSVQIDISILEIFLIHFLVHSIFFTHHYYIF